METPVLLKRDDFPGGRHRASSDPLSRGGAFLDGAGLLNQEPNPFEQSFGPLAGSSTNKPTDGSASASGRRARSTSPSSLMPRTTPGGTQRLPPLSLMQTPSGELSAFGWGVDSLRTGPLSPALLNGPTGTSGLYDPSALGGRTGLTPLVAGPSGAGAGAASSGGAGTVSFPPPSPATAALFAMMTNNTPGTSDAAALVGGGARPHEGANEANSFEASFARANSDNAITSGASKRNADALHRSALQNQMNGIGMGGSAPAVPQLHSIPGASRPPPTVENVHAPPPGTYAPPQPHSAAYYPLNGAPPSEYAVPIAGPPHGHAHAHGGYPVGARPPRSQMQFTAPPPPSNPLDLLTAASNYNDDAVVAAAALSGLATPGGGFPAAAILAAQQQAQQVQQQAGAVMPGSTVSAGQMHQNGGSGPEGSPGPTTSANGGRGKRGAAAQQPAQGSPAPPAKRARKQTAAAAAAIAAEAGGLDDDDEMLSGGGGAGSSTGAGAKKAPAKRGRKPAAAAAAPKKEEFFDDGASVGTSADGDMGMYGYDDGMGGEGSAPPEQPKKGGRGRRKDTGETEEEKRRNFLERNRQAALKCRQRKKAWLQSLQTKVELLTTDNDALQSTVNNLKEEINSLRAILAAHANCPVAMSNHPAGQPMPPHMAPRGMPGPPPQGMPPASVPPPGYVPRAQY